MATKKKGPTKGGRILVKLPFGRTTKPVSGKSSGKNQLVKVKENVAKFLGFEAATELKTQTVSIKTAQGEKRAKRIVNQGSYRRESVTLLLDKARTIGKSPNKYKTINLPLGSGCTVTDAIVYYQTNGKSKGIVGIRTPDGVTHRWAASN